MCSSSTKAEIENAGERSFLVIYGCAELASTDYARVEKFHQKVSTNTQYVSPEKLPPTSNASKFHSYRTYHQVQSWRGNVLSAEDWGWSSTSSGLYPIKLSKSPAPDQLLNIMRCNCTGTCNSRACTCFKNGLKCTPACGQCKGITCLNSPPLEAEVDSEVEDDIL